ncbi:MAG TPA: PrgI family protein [Patescibacteria group bacterium]|nr:PrgI family protein [Patescibacteria group bacterium]
MQQFLVPQFLDVEPKVIGPITVRQFIVMMVGTMFIVIEYKLADFGLFILFGVFTLIVFGVLAFVKVNGRPFHYFLLTIMQTMKTPTLRVWNKEISKSEIKMIMKSMRKQDEETEDTAELEHKVLQRSRLSELSMIVNTGGAYRSEDDTPIDLQKIYGQKNSDDRQMQNQDNLFSQ